MRTYTGMGANDIRGGVLYDAGMERTYRKSCRRFNVPGHTHFLTFSCFGRQAFLMRERAREWLLDALRRALLLHDFSVWAWVFMPEHAHLLVHPRRESYSISAFLKSVKQPVTHAAVAHLRNYAPAFLERMCDVQPDGTASYRFWQRGGGYDENLWTPKYIWDKIRYIHRNPVKRGLVKEPCDWRWSSAMDFARRREPQLLPIDRTEIPGSW
jgi:putative transposase